MFKSAVYKLVIVYMAFVFAISIFFSIILYQVSITALQRGLRAPGPNSPYSMVRFPEFENFRLERYQEQKSEIIRSIILMNIAIILAGAMVSYFLAQRTLAPIKDAMYRQKRFTADAAHELKTPLAIMRAEAEVTLKEKSPDKKLLDATIKSNLEETIRLQQLTESLLHLSQNGQVEMQKIDLISLARKTIDRYKKSQPNIKLETNKSQKIVIKSNKEHLSQIIDILLDNAIKYNINKSPIELKISKNKSTKLSVVDHGAGINKDDVEYIFDRFYRGDSSRSRQKTNGHGLGLSLAKHLAEQNGIDIYYKPTPKGGATFVLEFS